MECFKSTTKSVQTTNCKLQARRIFLFNWCNIAVDPGAISTTYIIVIQYYCIKIYIYLLHRVILPILRRVKKPNVTVGEKQWQRENLYCSRLYLTIKIDLWGFSFRPIKFLSFCFWICRIFFYSCMSCKTLDTYLEWKLVTWIRFLWFVRQFFLFSCD